MWLVHGVGKKGTREGVPLRCGGIWTYIHFLVSRSPSTLPARLIGEGELTSCLIVVSINQWTRLCAWTCDGLTGLRGPQIVHALRRTLTYLLRGEYNDAEKRDGANDGSNVPWCHADRQRELT